MVTSEPFILSISDKFSNRNRPLNLHSLHSHSTPPSLSPQMIEDLASSAGDPSDGAPQSISLSQELRFDGFGTGNGAPLMEDQTRREGHLDPRVPAGSGVGGAKYKSMSPAQLPISRSLRLTIPSGFSPSALLESPVLLTNMKVGVLSTRKL